ncbi:MAG: trans-sulfuration enzyme family protein [Peptococcaceae bacterium]
MKVETKAVRGYKGCDPVTGSLSFPIYQCATFKHPGLNQSTGYDYSRDQNPTREEVEKTLANLEGGKRCLAFSTGMAAIDVLLKTFSPGDHFLVSEDLYGGTYRLFEQNRKFGFDFTYQNTCHIEQVKTSIKKNTRCIFLETPSNPTMKVTDIGAIVDLARSAGIMTVVDNTFLTPYFQRPLEQGVDVVIHSGTKYLGGHNDALAGFLVVKNEKQGEELKHLQMSTGAILAPFESWLILRGMKTLGVRMEKCQKNAMAIAQWLKDHQNVEKVYYAGLPEHEAYAISKKQAAGFGGMISFTVKAAELVEQILGRIRLISFAESLGGVESLITYPLVQTHSAIPQEMLKRLGINHRLLRLSVGIEAVEDLIEDLEQAMR